MTRTILAAFLAVVVILFDANIQAAQETEVRKPARVEAREVQTRRITTRKPEMPVLVAGASARTMPKWAGQTRAAGSSGVNAGTTLAAPPKTELEKVTLSVRKIYTQHANLMFRLATINSDDNYAFWFADIPNVALGYVSAAMHVKAGERYLLDFKIDAQVPTTFGINVGDTKQDVSVGAGEHHLLAYLDATETTRVIALLNSNTARYTFHSLTVTRVD